ncbi:unnamed protein product, partial [Prorocentrum cordatum]
MNLSNTGVEMNLRLYLLLCGSVSLRFARLTKLSGLAVRAEVLSKTSTYPVEAPDISRPGAAPRPWEELRIQALDKHPEAPAVQHPAAEAHVSKALTHRFAVLSQAPECNGSVNETLPVDEVPMAPIIAGAFLGPPEARDGWHLGSVDGSGGAFSADPRLRRLWFEYWRVLGAREGRLSYLKVKSHATDPEEVMRQVVPHPVSWLSQWHDPREWRRQRCVLLSNTAQVQVALADWPEVVRLASLALEDDPDHAKSSLRLARAHMEMCELEDAAQAVDVALSRLAARQGAADDAARLELSKVAEELSKALPGWRWTCSRPKLAEQRKGQEDFEKRIVGVWEYGQAVGQKNSFQIRLEPWGALVFQEESIKIDLMRKGLLRWRGELELVSGMVLNLSYEPGSDVMTTEFIPPPDVPEEQRWKGPSRFTATRSASAAPEAAPTAAAEEPPSSPRRPAADQVAPPEPPAPPPAAPELSEEERAALATQGVPTELWLAGRPELRGRYALVAGRIAGDRPIFRREPQAGSSTGELFLWSRGGNWGVTASLHASSLAAPFLARCPDPSGRARHPLELRRPRWQVRTGRGQEELDASMELTAEPPVAASSSTALAEAPGARAGGSSTLDEAAAGPPPPAVEIRGRVGEHSQVNGVYALSGSSWEGRPVYWQREQERQERPLALFWENGYWTVAAEACSLPRSLARCPAAAGSGAAAGPVSAVRGAWEFLCGERLLGAMVTSETRVYK